MNICLFVLNIGLRGQFAYNLSFSYIQFKYRSFSQIEIGLNLVKNFGHLREKLSYRNEQKFWLHRIQQDHFIQDKMYIVMAALQ